MKPLVAPLLILLLTFHPKLGIAAQPNIIVLLADDAGYADFGFQGGGIHGDFSQITPHIDALAMGGVTFTNGYVSAAVCTPSRASLLTGRYSQRFGVETVYGNQPDAGLPATEITMADLLREAGYRTYALGKWHLGEDLEEHHPNQRGFDEFYGVLTGARTFYAYTGRNNAAKVQRNGTFLPETASQPYFTDLLANEAVAYIDTHLVTHPGSPFFFYLAFTAVHTPLEADPKRLEDPRIRDIQPKERKTLAAMTLAMDDAVGRIMDKLRETGFDENTLVVFLSDNGGPENNTSLRAPNWSDNGPLRGNKSQNFEGGIRVPFVAHWPSGIVADLTGAALPDVVTALDLLPTFLNAANGALPTDRTIDGLSLLPRLRGEVSRIPARSLVWRQGQQKAVRQGEWKFYQGTRTSPPELYNLSSDVSESQNVADSYPEVIQKLQQVYADWEHEMVAPLWRPGGSLTNQPPAVPASSPNLLSTFKNLDRNRDGRVTRNELPRSEVFDRFDRNGDGVIEPAEVGISLDESSPAPAKEPAQPETQNRISSSQAFQDLTFSRDWDPGTRDSNGNLMTGTETNYIVVHEGQLFASIGAWNADRSIPDFPGPLVLTKPSADAAWEVDFSAGRNSVRIAALTPLIITTDANGQKLKEPVPLLAAGVSGNEYPGEVCVFTRNDSSGKWEKSIVTRRNNPRGGEIRHVFDHLDSITGVHHVFAAISGGEIYRATYNSDLPGRLAWHPEPELSGRMARIMSHVIANDRLYLAVDITPDAPQNGGLFQRVDGPNAHWKWLGEWGTRTQHQGVAWIRGMTAIPDPGGSGRERILASRETDGLIELIDPAQTPPTREAEFDFKAYFANFFGAGPNHQIGSILAYNEMTPATHPKTQETVHLITGGARSFLPGRPGNLSAEALILLRHRDGSYSSVPIPKLAGEDSLRAVRTICPSPFPGELGQTWYIGGFDAAQGPHDGTAWLYRAEIP